MVQFKTTFLGEAPRPYVRAVSSQKCMRAGGKHNDLDQVGRTARHHTFFEMLGNFSFGNYFKKEAIAYAWELVTEVFRLPPDRLFLTVYQDDDETEHLWTHYVPKRQILRLGEKDNFWQMGETGPCGPCSEILIDQGEALHPHCPGIGHGDGDRYIEIWNLVFMQYNRSAAGTVPLPHPSIDTGMGLERMTAICQGVPSNYETDLFGPIFAAIANRVGQSKETVTASVPARVIADHLRAMTFLISDGVIPGNEGRGYVLRRVIRRAARFGRKLLSPSSLETPFLHSLTGVVIDTLRLPYPELELHRKQIDQMVQMEEERFEETLIRGGGFLEEMIQSIHKKNERTVPGEALFKLYDTYGFPLDLAAEVACEAGLAIDEAGFSAAMELQKDRARRACVMGSGAEDSPAKATLSAALETSLRGECGPIPFHGHDRLEEEVVLLAILQAGQRKESALAGEEVDLVFDKTPFYSESGGQVGDCGTLIFHNTLVTIEDTQRPASDLCLHRARVVYGKIAVGDHGHAEVNGEARQSAARNHTATHLLHAVLREMLGDHVKQAGSLVAPDRLRFDFQHFSALSQWEIDRIEARVNQRILESVSVCTRVMEVKEAIASGAMALFGEKYGEQVRVVSVSDFSRELCGGTHCRNTGEIGLFKIVREGSVASGIRRIEAVTGTVAYQSVKKQENALREMAALLKTSVDEVTGKTGRLVAQSKERDREIERLKTGAIENGSESETHVQVVGSVPLIAQKIAPADIKTIRLCADRLRERIKSGIVVVGAADEAGEKATVVVMVTPDWAASYPASKIAAQIAPVIGGSGGGKAEMAQAGGKTVEQLEAAIAQAVVIIREMGTPE
jgi:alanyl-tRNA synthetase